MLRVLEKVSVGAALAPAVPEHVELGPGCIVQSIWIEAPPGEVAGTFGTAVFKAEDMVVTVDRAPGYKHFQGLRLTLPAHCTITNGRVNIVYDDGMNPR